MVTSSYSTHLAGGVIAMRTSLLQVGNWGCAGLRGFAMRTSLLQFFQIRTKDVPQKAEQSGIVPFALLVVLEELKCTYRCIYIRWLGAHHCRVVFSEPVEQKV